MKSTFLYIVYCLILMGCTLEERSKASLDTVRNVVSVPDKIFGADQVFYDPRQSLWIHMSDSTFVSGYIHEYYPNGSLAKKTGVYNGKKEGKRLVFFANGQVKFSEEYRNNKVHGEVKRWVQHQERQLIAHLRYEAGKLHGEQMKWYDTGELHKVLNLSDGKEEGMQKAYRKNGALYANYEALNGRIFGLKRSNLCFELDNENVVYSKP